MEDFGSGLYFTLNGEDDDIFCQNCRKLREQLKEEENGREATIQVIQDKVILTDRLVKSFEKKAKLHEHSSRVMGDQENVNKLLAERCSKYEGELSRLIGELEFLRTTNQILVEEKEKCSMESSELKNQIAAYEVTVQQYKNYCDEKKVDDIKAATSKKMLSTKEKEVSKLKDDVARLNNVVQEKKNEIKQRKVLYKKAVLHVEKFLKNLEASEAGNDEKLVKSCQSMLEKVKRFAAVRLDDVEGSFDSEAEDGKKIEDLLHSDIEASPVSKPPDVAVKNPQFASENTIHETSAAECTSVGIKDDDLASDQHATVTKNENICSGSNGFYDHLPGICSSDTSAVTVNKHISNSDQPCYGHPDSDSVREICIPSNFRDSVTDNSGVQYISDEVGKTKESSICEATSNGASVSKNGSYVEAHNLLLDGSNSLDDFSSDFAEMKSQMCLKKEMLSPLSPLPPTPPPRSSSSPDVFRDRSSNITCSDRPRGRSNERLRTIPWGKNLLHQPSEGFEPAFDDLTNSCSNNDYFHQHRRSSSCIQHRSLERESNDNTSEGNGAASDKSFEASILYDEHADCFSLSVDPKSKGLVTIKAFKSGIVSFNWQDSRNRRHTRSSSCVARIQSPSNENKAPPGTQSTGTCDAAVGTTRVQDNQNFGSHAVNQEYTDRSSSFKRKLFKEPRLPQFTAANTSSLSITRPSNNTIKSESTNPSLTSSFRKASEQNVPFAAHVKPSIASKPFINCESNLSVHFHPRSEEITVSNSSNQSSKDPELPHRGNLKSEERGQRLVLNKPDSAEFSCSPEADNLDDEQPPLKCGKRLYVDKKRYQKPSEYVNLEKPSLELPHSRFPKGSNYDGHPVLQKNECSGSNLTSPVKSGNFSPEASNADLSSFKEKPNELTEEGKSLELLRELHSSTTFHKLNKCAPQEEPSISSIPCSKFQSLSDTNVPESSQSDSRIGEKDSQEVLMNEMPEEINAASLFESELQNVSDKSQSVIHGDTTSQKFPDAQSYCTDSGESNLTIQSPAELKIQGKSHENEVLCGNLNKPVPSEGSLVLQHLGSQDINDVDVTEENPSAAKKLKQTRFQRCNKYLQSDEQDSSNLKQVFQMVRKHDVVHGSLTKCSKSQKISSLNSGTDSCETGTEYQKTVNKDISLGKSKFAKITSPKSNEISDLSNIKGQDLVVVRHSGSTVSLKSPQSSSPKEICSPALPPCKLSEVDECETLTSQSELSDLKSSVQHLPKKRKRIVEPHGIRSKVQKVSSLGFRTNSLERTLKDQETDEVLSHGESVLSFITSPEECSGAHDLNKEEKVQDESASSVLSKLPGNAHSPKNIHRLALPLSELSKTDESLNSQTELNDLDTKTEQPGECVPPRKKKKVAKTRRSGTQEKHDQGNFEHNLRSTSKSPKAKLRAQKPLSSQKSQKSSPIKSENVRKVTKLRGVKKQRVCSASSKPDAPDFVHARIQKIKYLNKFDEILEPVKPKNNINSNKRKRKSPGVSHIMSSNDALNGNIQNDNDGNILSNGQTVSSPEHESAVNELSMNGQLVVSDNKDDCAVSIEKQTSAVKNEVAVVGGLNGVKQTLSATNGIQVLGDTCVADVKQNVSEEQKVTDLGNSLKTENVNSVPPTFGNQLMFTVAEVHKSETDDDFTSMDCNVTSEVCNGDQKGIVTHSELETSNATNQLNGLVLNVNGVGNVNDKVTLNCGSEKQQISHAVIKQEKVTHHVPVLTDSVSNKKNDSKSMEQKPIPVAENKDPLISPLCDDEYFNLGLGNISFNPMLLNNLENLKKANSFNCRGAQRMLVSALCNPMLVPNVQEAVLTIVHFLSLCEEDPWQYTNEASDINPPVVLPYEGYLINCVREVQDKHKTHLKNFFHALLSVIKAQIIFNKSLKVYGVASLCRVFTELHKTSNGLVGPRILCYDILVAHPDTRNVPYLLAAIVGVWPKVLDFGAVFQGTQNPVYLAISSILFNGSLKYSDVAEKCLNIICSLSKLCPLEDLPSVSTEILEKIFDDLIKNEDNESFTEEQASQYAKAVELICFREDWQWAYNSVLVVHIYPYLNRWIVKNRASDQPKNIAAIKTVFHLLCAICYRVPPDELETVNIILTTLRTFLVDPTQNAPFAAQEAAFVTLLRLGSLNKEITVPTIFTWLEKNKNEISPGTWNLVRALPYIVLPDSDTPRLES